VAGEPTSGLPDADRAIVEESRVRQYLLNPLHPDGGSKAVFFLARHFNAEHWHDLCDALIVHARNNQVTRSVQTQWGLRCTVERNRPTPDGHNPCIRTVSQLEDAGP
jgi:hypothetical protein